MKLLSLLCLLCASVAIASAGVIYSTDGTATPGFFPSNGSTSTSSGYHAYQFTVAAGQGGVVDELVVPGQTSTAFTETFYVLSDSSGSIGSILDTFSATAIGDSVSRLYTASPTNHITLVEGTAYWIEAASPSGANAFLWLQADPIATSREYSSFTGYFNDQPLDGFALLSAPAASGVPEPATWLLSSGLILLALRSLRRSRHPAR